MSNLERDSTIHIVEDDDAVRDSLRQLLEEEGHCVMSYCCAEDYLRSSELPGDGLLVDFILPHMNGLELLELLHRKLGSVTAIIITGAPVASIRGRAALMDVEVLAKPVREEVLLHKIDTLLRTALRRSQPQQVVKST